MNAAELQVFNSHDFPYPTLETPDSIRLLTLLGVKGDFLSFRLETVALETCNNYIALSYEWGGETATEDILVNGRDFNIRSNLYSFIVRNLLKLYQRQIFIDAVCINQQDPAEKQVQIALMGRVYTQAAEVVAWLGSRPPLDGLTIHRWPLSRLMDEYETTKSQYFRRRLRRECAARLLKTDIEEAKMTPHLGPLLDDLEEEWVLKLARLRKTMPPASSFVALDEALRVIEHMEILDLELWCSSFDADFWTRCWIVQELTLARSLTLQLGNHTIPAEVYLLLTSATLPGEIGFGGSLGAASEVFFGRHLDGPLYEVGLGPETEHSFGESGVRRARNVLSLRQRYQQSSLSFLDVPLHVAVEKTCKQECSHPHDHVFSLLGIASTSAKVDYETDLILLYIYVLAEGMRDLFRGGNVARPYRPWNVPSAFMIAFHYSMAQPAVWVVTSQILQLYQRRRTARAFMHSGLFLTQALWSDSFIKVASVRMSVAVMYALVLRPVLSLVTPLWFYVFHSYNRWRGKAVSGPAPDGPILSYHQWETVVERVFFLVQNKEPLRWRSVREVLAEDQDADRFRLGEET